MWRTLRIVQPKCHRAVSSRTSHSVLLNASCTKGNCALWPLLSVFFALRQGTICELTSAGFCFSALPCGGTLATKLTSLLGVGKVMIVLYVVRTSVVMAVIQHTGVVLYLSFVSAAACSYCWLDVSWSTTGPVFFRSTLTRHHPCMSGEFTGIVFC